jgi:hypothetical protein
MGQNARNRRYRGVKGVRALSQKRSSAVSDSTAVGLLKRPGVRRGQLSRRTARLVAIKT